MVAYIKKTEIQCWPNVWSLFHVRAIPMSGGLTVNLIDRWQTLQWNHKTTNHCTHDFIKLCDCEKRDIIDTIWRNVIYYSQVHEMWYYYRHLQCDIFSGTERDPSSTIWYIDTTDDFCSHNKLHIRHTTFFFILYKMNGWPNSTYCHEGMSESVYDLMCLIHFIQLLHWSIVCTILINNFPLYNKVKCQHNFLLYKASNLCSNASHRN